MAVGELCGPVSRVAAGKLYTAGELYGCGRAVWPWASYMAVGKLYAAGELCGRGQAMWP
jgi:hypothetical protein